ncbi:PAS domain-containing sensor histidine kinase [Methanolobus sp. WCC4]|uniref:PAS domain-containing sensor histidine kinase n=1 Tax=Methanolobus sp. WCC4 TaxID=3125784 RepID=UPI0030F8A318
MEIKKEEPVREDVDSGHSSDTDEPVHLSVRSIPFSEIEAFNVSFDLLDHPVFIIDKDGLMLFANKSGRSYLGLSEADISQDDLIELHVPEDQRKRARSFFTSVLSDPCSDEDKFELPLMGVDGEQRIFLLQTGILNDTMSSDNALLLSCMDIHGRKQQEDELLLEFEMLYDHLYSIPYALVLSDYKGMITFWNEHASNIFGYSRDEMIGQHITLIMPKRYRKAHEGWDEIVSIGKSPIVGKIVELTGLRKDGTELPIEIAVTTTRMKGNIFHGAIINDISKRKMRERLTSIAKNKYRMMFEKSPLGIFHFDENGVITQCNENLVKILDVPVEDVISQVIGFNMLESFEDDNSIKKAVQQVLAGIPARYEDDFHSPFSDKAIPIKAEFSPVISDEGKFMGGVCVVEDFTERKAAEKALNQYAEDLAKANEELKSLDRMKDEFISNLRHELKTPLIPLKGYSELMYEGALGELTDKQKNAAEKMMLSSERLRRLIDSLIYVSITEGGNVEYSFVPLRVSEMIDSAVHDRSPEITSKGHKVELSIAKDIPLINGDLDYLEEVFIHIIDNAIKFMHKDGILKISAKLQDDDKIHIKVADNGIGISEDNLSHIFDRFYQVDGSSTRKYGGNGLGLYICKKIIEAHSGDIWAESKEGRGTSIHILLPAK